MGETLPMASVTFFGVFARVLRIFTFPSRNRERHHPSRAGTHDAPINQHTRDILTAAMVERR
jgi:hypothetical protein